MFLAVTLSVVPVHSAECLMVRQDELDIANEKAKNLVQVEATLERYKAKLAEMGDLKARMKEAEVRVRCFLALSFLRLAYLSLRAVRSNTLTNWSALLSSNVKSLGWMTSRNR
jgi:hypothetical protein